MKIKKCITFIIVLFTAFSLYSQDIIIRKDGEIINCKITKVDNLRLHFDLNSTNGIYSTFIALNYVKSYQIGSVQIVPVDSIQVNNIPKNNSNTVISYDKLPNSINDDRIKQAGKELIKFSNNYYTGLGLMVGGYIVMYIGANQKSEPILLVGGLVSLIGTIFQLECNSHVGKAGRILTGQTVALSKNMQIGPNSSGYGLAFNLPK
jgi:hypothetical protein